MYLSCIETEDCPQLHELIEWMNVCIVLVCQSSHRSCHPVLPPMTPQHTHASIVSDWLLEQEPVCWLLYWSLAAKGALTPDRLHRVPQGVCPLKSRSLVRCEHAVRTPVQFHSVTSVHWGEVWSGHGTDTTDATTRTDTQPHVREATVLRPSGDCVVWAQAQWLRLHGRTRSDRIKP